MSKSLYFLVYSRGGKRGKLVLREPTVSSRDFIRIRGVRANEIFNDIMSVLNAYTLKFTSSKDNNRVVVELPADVGYAVLVYLLLVYNARKPGEWVCFLEKLLAGKIPLSTYLKIFINIAIDLSDLKYKRGYKKTVIKPSAAIVVSSMMRTLAKNLQM